jgi:hypothetical protein
LIPMKPMKLAEGNSNNSNITYRELRERIEQCQDLAVNQSSI